MTLHAIVDNGKIVEYRHLAEVPKLDGKPYRQVLPVVDVDPPFDPTRQTRTGPVAAVEKDRVTRVWTVTDKPAEEIAREAEERRDEAATAFDREEDLLRASALVLLDELNLHAERIASILQAAGSATSLSTFKTAMAAINPVPQRTPAQLRTAIRAKLGT